jgi:hypothetical protein
MPEYFLSIGFEGYFTGIDQLMRYQPIIILLKSYGRFDIPKGQSGMVLWTYEKPAL